MEFTSIIYLNSQGHLSSNFIHTYMKFINFSFSLSTIFFHYVLVNDDVTLANPYSQE